MGYVAVPLNARPVSTGSRIRAATSRLVQVVQGRRMPLGCTTFDRQSSEPLNDTVVALGSSSFKPRAEAPAYSITPSASASDLSGTVQLVSPAYAHSGATARSAAICAIG